MRPATATTLALTLLVATACDGGSGGDAALDSEAQKASYAIGRNVGRSLAPTAGHLDMDAFLKGVDDMLEERDPALPEEEMQAALQAFSQSIQEAQQADMAAEAEENRTASRAFLDENAAREGVSTTDSGLQYEVVEAGDGPRPTAEDRVVVHYVGTLPDGTTFDSSRERGQPATFDVSGMIPGFTEALTLMPVGSTYRFVIPAELAYGPQGSPPAIGPEQALVFEVELIEIQ